MKVRDAPNRCGRAIRTNKKRGKREFVTRRSLSPFFGVRRPPPPTRPHRTGDFEIMEKLVGIAGRRRRGKLPSLCLATIPPLLLGLSACSPQSPAPPNQGNNGSAKGGAGGGSGGSSASAGGSGGSSAGAGGGDAGRGGNGTGGRSSSGTGGTGTGGTGTGGTGGSSGGAGGAVADGGGGGDTGPSTPDAGSDVPGPGAAGPSAYKVYLGQTHAHSVFSNVEHPVTGDEPAAGFAKAKAAGADFYFITDHVGYEAITASMWQRTKEAADAATTATFVAGAGVEFILDGDNEMNSYAMELDANHTAQRTKLSGVAYADYLKKYPGAFAQWNHPLRGGGIPPHSYTGRTPERDAAVALLELLAGSNSPMDAAYQQALDAGWHIGPAAGHDNHGGGWFALGTRTGVLATSLTRENIYDGIRQSRVFCTQDAGLKVWYDINGTIMGANAPMAATYKATVKIEGGKGVTKVEIVTKGGMVVTSGAPAAGTWSADLTGVTAGSFYFARLTGGGGKTWTAPVWIGP
jgi:hypothetical protein